MAQRATTGLKIVLSGKAEVFCVHDRKKREVVTEEQVFALGMEAGIILDKRVHRLFSCTCCDNLFVADGSSERHCTDCQRPLVHAPGGPLPEPKGAIG